MIVSRHLSEPDSALAQGHSLIPPTGFGSESSLSKMWRAVRRAVLLRLPSLGAARQPFDRLEFWTVRHPLVDRLKIYEATQPSQSIWRGFSWATLRYWERLLDDDFDFVEGLELPTVEEWFGDLDRLVRAEPFSD